MRLESDYLGLALKNPIVPSASPLSASLDGLKRMEDAGAAAVVLYSLFEEQIEREEKTLLHHLEHYSESHAESLSYLPAPAEFPSGPQEYAEHVRKAKEALGIPVIASLNGASRGGWVEFAAQIEEAGADALELNLYELAADPAETGETVEARYADVVSAVKKTVAIPLAVKIGPYFSSLGSMARRLTEAGAGGLVLFNRFYQPDIKLESLEIESRIVLSGEHDLRLPLTWIGLLYGRLDADLAASGGVRTHEDVLKLLMAGASAVMMCSELLRNGAGRIKNVLEDMSRWMDEHEYESVRQLRGSMSQKACPDPKAYERANYMRMLIGCHL